MKEDPRAIERRERRNSPKSPLSEPYSRDPLHTYIADEESGKELVRAIINDPIAPAVPHVRLHAHRLKRGSQGAKEPTILAFSHCMLNMLDEVGFKMKE